MAPRNSRSAGNRRYYDWRGERFWSVTTLTKGGLPEGYGLAKWKRYSVARGAVEAAQAGILMPMIERAPRAAIEYLAELPFQKQADAADLGTAIHDAIESRLLERPAPDPPEAALPYLAQFERFVERYQPEFLLSEASVYNRTHMYAGTLDSVVKIGGRLYVLDVKTGSGIYPEVALQLAAYRNAEFIGAPDDSEQPMFETEPVGIGLHLQPDWFEPHRVDLRQDVFDVFLYCRETFRWDQVIARQVLTGTFPAPGDDPIADAQRAGEVPSTLDADPGRES
jgi:hypothetical protein